ncbi:MAG TPA: hypothetical protein VLM75_05300 [Spirochaetota bacterium]|nr:hypothetical protein [Spirochaetota bacterium]
MNRERIRFFRETARQIALSTERPVFYVERAAEMAYAERLADSSERVAFARSAIRENGGAMGHGFDHAHRVAIEAGAIVRCEMRPGPECDRLAENALIAGYLHDIRRGEKRHAEAGAIHAGIRLRGRLDPDDCEIIVFAIRNHEAFREKETAADAGAELVSGALYDADKFRWGPDNFTDTVWDMAEAMRIDPLLVFEHYDQGVLGIRKIRGTFRTVTGKRYGPDFIDRGLLLGERLISRLRENMDIFP